MNCTDVCEQLLEVAVEGGPVSPEIQSHCAVCEPCALQREQIKRTMALLDEWQAPEPSPYFDVRLQARLREEQQKPAAGWLAGFANRQRSVWQPPFCLPWASAHSLGGKATPRASRLQLCRRPEARL